MEEIELTRSDGSTWKMSKELADRMIAAATDRRNAEYESDFWEFQNTLEALQERFAGQWVVMRAGEIEVVCKTHEEAVCEVDRRGLPRAFTFVGYVPDPNTVLIV